MRMCICDGVSVGEGEGEGVLEGLMVCAWCECVGV